jgi:hypothetical protein
VAKIAELVSEMGTTAEYDLDAVWNRQEVPEATMQLALAVAPRVMRVLTAENRPVTNVTEWAKRAECWNSVKAMPVDVPELFSDDLVSRAEASGRKRAARSQHKVDLGINDQAEVLAIPAHEWVAMAEFAAPKKLVSPAEAQMLALVTGARPGLPSELQSKRLLAFKQRVIDNGYSYLT